MEQTEKKTKPKLYKVAAELNLSHDVVMEYLKKKGFAIKSIMSSVDDEMMDEIHRHFKKEKVDAERHARKRKEFDEKDRKRRGEHDAELPEEKPKPAAVKPAKKTETKTTEKTPRAKKAAEPPTKEKAVEEAAPVEVVAEPPIELAAPVAEETLPIPVEALEPEPVAVQQELELTTAPPPEATIVEPTQVVAEEEIPAAVIAEGPPDETAAPVLEEIPITGEAPVATPGEDTSPLSEAEQKAEAEGKRRKKPKKELDVSLEASMPKMGLKVMGKIDLDALKKQQATKPKTAATAKDGTAGAETEEGVLKKKKKKKKIVKVEEPVVAPVETEDRRKKKTLKPKGREVDMTEVNDAIKRTFAMMDDSGPVPGRTLAKKRKREKRQIIEQKIQETADRDKNVIKVSDFMTVNEIASMMHASAAEVISKLMGLGVMASINQRLDFDTITLVAADFGFDVIKLSAVESEEIEDLVDAEETLTSRPPIVTIMGHVDHGKTSLLDYIRDTNVVAGEAGGITQHIGAYTVSLDGDRRITFLDTPGHEAFTAMRARGAQVTDIVVLVVAADDNVMPQTVEAISHALAANVPIVVAINKIDKAESNPERIRQQLSERNVLVEQWGGRYGCVEISAKKGMHVDELLNRILLEADLLDLKANPDRHARGVVIEAELDRGKGIVATVLIQKGTLSVGDPFVVGTESGKVRLLLDERGHKITSVPPSTPVQVIGFDGMPQAGDVFAVLDSDRDAREIGNRRQQLKREMNFRQLQRKTLDDISAQIKMGGIKELSLVVKGDVDGSVEALSDAFMKLSTAEVQVKVIHKGIGAISESDVLLASASDAIIVGFHVRPNLNARRLAQTEHVDIRLYEIIYDAIQEVRNALEGMLSPEIKEEIVATIVIRETFKISHVGTIAGSYVQDGKITRNSKVRLIRDGIVTFTGGISALKRFKDDVREVEQGYECGISLDGFNDVKVGDVIEAFKIVETKRALAN